MPSLLDIILTISNDPTCFRNEKIMYYVIQVITGDEEKTIDAIKKQIGNKEGFDVFAPFRKVIRKYRGVEKEVIQRCFPGYIFVETDKPKDLFFDLFWIPKYTKLLGREGLTYNFCPLDKDEARMIDILYSKHNNRTTEISNIEVIVGQKIKVLDGPLSGLETQIQKVNLHKRTVTVSFMMCGRSVTADVAINIITNVINK